MSSAPTPARYIRETVFGFQTQEAFADELGVTQVTVSRYETGAHRLSAKSQERIREMAKQRHIPWDNNWFFEVPSPRPREFAQAS